MQDTDALLIDKALPDDLEALLAIENACFRTDRLSRRSFKRWLRRSDCVFLVARDGTRLAGYCLVLLRQGTRLARLYSLAVAPGQQGRGIARQLLKQAETEARRAGALYLRLEVAASNAPAISLYEQLGYTQFGRYDDYYEDHSDALRMEKCVRAYQPEGAPRHLPWLAQTLPFTCGPAALMMAMAGLKQGYQPSPLEEIEIWREATTIFMTSGHGGCHPLGLALAAKSRGFHSEVWVNTPGPLFIDGVRNENKKRVMSLVHDSFLAQCAVRKVAVHYEDIEHERLLNMFDAGANILILISTYRLDSKKAPHWVVLSGYDEACLYVHDPELDDLGAPHSSRDDNKAPLDCQYLPIAREEFAAMSRFGGNRLRAVVVVRKQPRRKRKQ
ncbi:MAG: peptidase C39 family protein [Haliea sp.]|nr:peptidase C39 family protein [Haliea sp.]MDP4917942.1 peptidase C39 family protein [Haliea sp.]MDP5064643.1 peptidase C39 family protein [Haliea sp.]